MGTLTVGRKFPRVDVDHPGVLVARSAGAALVRQPISIRSISCEGVGLALGDKPHVFERRTLVTVEFEIDGHHFEIPGLIVWLARATERRGALDLGVWFKLALACQNARQAYARWIVDFVRSKGVAQPLLPSRT